MEGSKRHITIECFWDGDNVRLPPHTGLSGIRTYIGNLEANLVSAVGVHDDVRVSVGALRLYIQPASGLSELALQHVYRAGVQIHWVPNATHKPERVDFAILRDMETVANRLDRSAASVALFVISGDADFISPLQGYRHRGFNTGIVHTAQTAHCFRHQPIPNFDWETMIDSPVPQTLLSPFDTDNGAASRSVEALASYLPETVAPGLREWIRDKALDLMRRGGAPTVEVAAALQLSAMRGDVDHCQAVLVQALDALSSPHHRVGPTLMTDLTLTHGSAVRVAVADVFASAAEAPAPAADAAGQLLAHLLRLLFDPRVSASDVRRAVEVSALRTWRKVPPAVVEKNEKGKSAVRAYHHAFEDGRSLLVQLLRHFASPARRVHDAGPAAAAATPCRILALSVSLGLLRAADEEEESVKKSRGVIALHPLWPTREENHAGTPEGRASPPQRTATSSVEESSSPSSSSDDSTEALEQWVKPTRRQTRRARPKPREDVVLDAVKFATTDAPHIFAPLTAALGIDSRAISREAPSGATVLGPGRLRLLSTLAGLWAPVSAAVLAAHTDSLFGPVWDNRSAKDASQAPENVPQGHSHPEKKEQRESRTDDDEETPSVSERRKDALAREARRRISVAESHLRALVRSGIVRQSDPRAPLLAQTRAPPSPDQRGRSKAKRRAGRRSRRATQSPVSPTPPATPSTELSREETFSVRPKHPVVGALRETRECLAIALACVCGQWSASAAGDTAQERKWVGVEDVLARFEEIRGQPLLPDECGAESTRELFEAMPDVLSVREAGPDRKTAEPEEGVCLWLAQPPGVHRIGGDIWRLVSEHLPSPLMALPKAALVDLFHSHFRRRMLVQSARHLAALVTQQLAGVVEVLYTLPATNAPEPGDAAMMCIRRVPDAASSLRHATPLEAIREHNQILKHKIAHALPLPQSPELAFS